MKAAVYYKYGPPEVVSIATINRPIPKENEVLIKVYASTVNRTDAGIRSAVYVISRLFSGLLRPRNQVLGCEFAGEIIEVGNAVQQFAIGDYVFGFDDKKFGGHALYKTISELEGIAKIPDQCSFTTAACITEGGHYALCNIKASKIKAGEKAMVYGASGAIGSAAVQLLKQMGVEVTAVVGTQHLELAKTLGADFIIDYQAGDFTQSLKQYEFIFDAVGKTSFKVCRPFLTSKGVYISTELGKASVNVRRGLIASLLPFPKILFPIPYTKKEDIEFLGSLVADGKYKPVIDRTFPLEEIVEAYRYVATGQKTGNVILTITHE